MSLPVKVKQEDLDKLKGIYYELLDSYDYDKSIKEVFIIHVKSKEDLFKVDRVYVEDIRFRNSGNILKSDVNDTNIIVFFSLKESIKALNRLIKINFIYEDFRDYKYEDVFN